MYGAIIGDFIGSIYEYKEFLDCRKKHINTERRKSSSLEKELFKDRCFYSDDTILTMAVLDAIISNKDYEKAIKEYATNSSLYSKTNEQTFETPFSKNFLSWCNNSGTNNSIGNGASMRISPIAYMFDDLDKIYEEVTKCTLISHNTEEALKGAKAVAASIYMARKKRSKKEIKDHIEKHFDYSLEFELNDLHNNYFFSSITSNSIPQAIYIFLISNSYEDLMRKALYIGGDTDTIACIAGSIGEAYYGLDYNLIEKANKKLPKQFTDLLNKAYSFMNNKKARL